MKPRAKLKPKRSITDRVAEYDGISINRCKGGAQAAKELGITIEALYNARTVNKKKRHGSIDLTLPIDEKDILVISKIGVAKAERIIRLLRQLR